MREASVVRRVAVLLVALVSGAARGETLVTQRYGIRDGLPHARVNCLHQDAKGYLWIGTWEGLSRFDGERFVSYGVPEGLPIGLVDDIEEDGRGHLWVATHGGGVAVLLDDPGEGGTHAPDTFEAPRHQHFRAYRVGPRREANVVSRLFRAKGGTLYCVTEAGLYRVDLGAGGEVSFDCVFAAGRGWSAEPFEDAGGTLRLITPTVLARWDGRLMTSSPLPDDDERGDVVNAVERADGTRLVAFEHALYALAVDGDGSVRWRKESFRPAADERILALALDRAGRAWIASNAGLLRLGEGGPERLVRGTHVRTLLVDRDGDLWLGTQSDGAWRCPLGGATGLTTVDGLPGTNVVRLAVARDGRLVARTDAGLAEIDGLRVRTLAERTPRFDGGMSLAQDAAGAWWVGTADGLYRFDGPSIARQRGRRVGAAQGFAGRGVFGAIHATRDGHVLFGSNDGQLYRCTTAPHCERLRGAVPGSLVRETLVTRSGRSWLATYVELAREERGTFRVLHDVAGLRDLDPRALYEDRRGRLWVGTRFHGAVVCDAPDAEVPVFEAPFSGTAFGSDAVWSIAEDAGGALYFATARGIVRAQDGTVRRLTTADGLAGDVVNHVVADRDGHVWAAAAGGLTRLDPTALRVAPAPRPVFLYRVQVAGENVPLPETGSRDVQLPPLPKARNSVLFEFGGIDLRGEHALRYQFRLVGLDHGWSSPEQGRSVNYARLGAGNYTFEVRALDRDGTPNGPPAVVRFVVLPPIWLRWWFVAGCFAVVAGVLAAAHRVRVRRVLAVEETRRRIALDLHDEVGAGLAEIAIISEVARREAEPPAVERLESIASLARSLRESMADIVWSIDPRRDRLIDLVQRLRVVAFNLLGAAGARVTFTAPEDRELQRVALSADRRRHLLLIAKESLANAARHAHAESVSVALSMLPGRLQLVIADDGRGFDTGTAHDGHGQESLQQRANALGGTLRVQSAPGAGTTVELTVPVGQRPALPRMFVRLWPFRGGD